MPVEAAALNAPQAIQVADRWHLWHNLAGHVEKTVARHHRCLTGARAEALRERQQHLAETAAAVTPPATPPRPAPADDRGPSPAQQRLHQRYQAVHDLAATGLGAKTIARELNLARGTVRRYLRAPDINDLLDRPRAGRPSQLDPHLGYLHQRLVEGATNAVALYEEIARRGYRGSPRSVRAYIKPLRAPAAALQDAGPVPGPVAKPRAIISWILRHPDDLDEQARAGLTSALAACPHLRALAGHVSRFAAILTGLTGHRLDDWLQAVDAETDQPDLASFAAGLRRDLTAVVNGLTLAHNSGPVEGAVNRIKTIKRQMYGRAGLDLLRRRILLP